MADATPTEHQPSTTFTDQAGREWDLRINGYTMTLLAEKEDIDIGRWFEKGLEKHYELIADLPRFVRILSLLLQDQMVAANVSPRQFGEALYGDTLEQAWVAWEDAIVNFFAGRERRETIRRILATNREVAEKLVMEMDTMTDKVRDTLYSELSTKWLEQPESLILDPSSSGK